ncbi:DUF6371 domain-containing protein [Aestuariivivens sediminicola]|uniref:DUF6371 domain-containing protein n=1 Tax=Aestuariivivens sediminicola TaxID=2913560 RepID=UPI001F565E31|nr:DUF6371 domain-containing protein [Aestuariivivens sediminicola]
MEKYYWHLQEYKGQNTRFRCPNCNKPREYTRFVNSNGEYAPFEYGRCNRINSCGYFNYPNKLKTDAPPYKPEKINQEFISWHDYNFKLSTESDLVKYFIELVNNEDRVIKTLEKYYVKTNGDYMIFPYVDKRQRLTYVKSMHYHNGHRTKRIHATFKAKKGKFKQCLFGYHLLRDGAMINVVESEKTALLCAMVYPEFIWLATGGQEMISKINVLSKANVFADKGKAFMKWKDRINLTKFSMNELLEKSNLPEGSDLADLLEIELKGNNDFWF